MDIDKIVPVLALIIGWLLNEASKGLQFRKKNKEAISCALADLLEIRHELCVIQFIFGELEKRFDFNTADLTLIKTYFNENLPKQENLHERYDRSVDLIAKNSPLLAFELRSKNIISPYLRSISSIAGDDIETLVYLNEMSERLRGIVIPEIERVIKKLASRYGFFTCLRIKSILKEKYNISSDLESMLDKIEADVKKAQENFNG